MTPSRGFYGAYKQRSNNKLRHCDLYVVRLLPAGRKAQHTRGDDARDACNTTAMFGNSKPCLRCLSALEAVGVHRVIFTSGELVAVSPADEARASGEQCIPCEVRTIGELMLESSAEGHSSRGDAQIHGVSLAPGCHPSAAQAAAACFGSKAGASKPGATRESPPGAGPSASAPSVAPVGRGARRLQS